MEPARATLQKLLASVLNRFPAEQVPLEAWPFVCGKQVSRRTQAVSFADGVLRVEVPDAAWRAQLQGLSADYLAGLNQHSATAVNRIEFVVAGAAAQAQKRHPPEAEQPTKQRQSRAGNRKGNGGNKSNRK
jgi:predicted nucleic acid-binding Zn ribbon protein